MNKNTINKIKELVNTYSRQDGWTELACLGPILANNNIKINELGHTKLKPFFESLSGDFIVSSDQSTGLPIVKTQSDLLLTKWASINQKEAIASLKELALDECWSYKKENINYPSPILASYLKWTFVKLYRENKILYSSKYAAFNTGLVDKFYKPIYALFEKNRKPMQPWFFKSFCVSGSNCFASRILTDNFSTLPQRATYITNYDDIMFDCSLPIDISWEHIILENIARLPVEFLKQACMDQNDIINNSETGEFNYPELKTILEKNPTRLAILSNMLKAAVDIAKLRVEWNYKTAIPIYYPNDDKIHLILPLALDYNKPDKISLALVMTKTPSNRYRAVTILTLDMAYTDARLVTKPSNEWLNAETIYACTYE